jgi:hypothetical protein
LVGWPVTGVCSFDGCERAHHSKGWCGGHYVQWSKGQEVRPLREPNVGCSFDGCDREHSSKGLCAAHYQQQRLGRPLKPLRAKTNQIGRRCSFELCMRWAATKGLCEAHYTQQRLGKPLTVVKSYCCVRDGCGHYAGEKA